MGHTAGDDPQAIIEHSFVEHCHGFYFTLLLAVNVLLLLSRVWSFSPHDIIGNTWSNWGTMSHDNHS
jgi:hypothetical protein